MKTRFAIFPIQHQDLWNKYKKVESQFWRADDGNYSEDKFEELHPSQQEYLKMLLCFFAVSDSVVADNLALNFLQEDIPDEAKFFYSYQLINENIHNETYSRLIDAYIKNDDEKDKAFNAVTEIPTVAKKMNWAYQWITNGSFEEKLIAFAAVEGLLFSSTFCGIFGFKDMKKHLPGLFWANTEINRDEASHYEFATYYYNNYASNKLDKSRLKTIILEAYEVEKQFIEDCFIVSPIGFNKDKMIQYIQYVTDTLLIGFNVDAEFNVSQPFKYMEQIAIPRRSNFFEGRNAEYSTISNTTVEIDLNSDF
jgi:ribonucleoside-diphosphate reductase beta chain